MDRQEKYTVATAFSDEIDNLELFAIKGLVASGLFIGGAAVNNERLGLGLTVAATYSAFVAILHGSVMIDLHNRVEELKNINYSYLT